MKIKRTAAWIETTRNTAKAERLWSDGWVIRQHTCTWQPPTDVYEDDDGVVIRVEIAGMRSEDFSISLAGCWLIIAGTRADPAPKRTYHQMEIRFGGFRTEVRLSWQVEPGDVKASYEEGFLTVRLPRPKVQRVPIAETQREGG